MSCVHLCCDGCTNIARIVSSEECALKHQDRQTDLKTQSVGLVSFCFRPSGRQHRKPVGLMRIVLLRTLTTTSAEVKRMLGKGFNM